MPALVKITHDGCQMKSYFVDGVQVSQHAYYDAYDACKILDSFSTRSDGKGAGSHRNCTRYIHSCEGR